MVDARPGRPPRQGVEQQQRVRRCAAAHQDRRREVEGGEVTEHASDDADNRRAQHRRLLHAELRIRGLHHHHALLDTGVMSPSAPSRPRS